MKNKAFPFFTFFFAFVFFSCEKKMLPIEESGTPVFYFKGEVDGTPVNLEAGNLDYYMNSSHYQDTTGVYVFKGNLKKDNCDSTCDYALTILINDEKTTQKGQTPDVSNALRIGEYLFNDKRLPPMYYKAVFNPVKNKIDTNNYHWKVITEGRDTMYSNFYSSKFILNANALYSVFLGYKSGTECDTLHKNIYKADTILQAVVSAERDLSSFSLVYTFSTTPKGSGPYKYLWDFGDGKPISTQAKPTHTFTPRGYGYYNVRLKLTDANNDTCISYYQINSNPDKTCDANFMADFSPIPNTKAYSAITIILTKPGGEVYTSKNTMQPKDSRFEVISVESYAANKNGEPTKRLRIKFNCVLKSGNKEIKITNGEAATAMSYK